MIQWKCCTQYVSKFRKLSSGHSFHSNPNKRQCQRMFKLLYVLCWVAQSCPTLYNPRDVACQAPLSLGILQARILKWVAMPSSRGIFTTQGSNPGLLHCRQILYHLSHYFCSSHMLARLCSKSFKLGFSSTWTKLDLEKAEEPEIKLPTFIGS